MRIDKAVSPPGWIQSAQCFSLFCAQPGLCIIKTGRGWRINYVVSHGGFAAPIAQIAADRVVSSLRDRASATEQTINPADLPGALQRLSGSTMVPWTSIQNIIVKTRHRGLPELSFLGNGKKLRFQFDPGRDAELEAFLSAWPPALRGA